MYLIFTVTEMGNLIHDTAFGHLLFIYLWLYITIYCIQNDTNCAYFNSSWPADAIIWILVNIHSDNGYEPFR